MDSPLFHELTVEKQKLVLKYQLLPDEKNQWISTAENSHPQLIFKHTFLLKNDIIGSLFRIYKLCFAKVNYFRENLSAFEPYIYHFEKGFIKTEWWDAEFFKHKKSGFLLDPRQLRQIVDIEAFHQFCNYLESF
ncbi:MAG: hypothetical protein MJB14_17570 [Spirochaetes bacterium]|nr:hypothetical protein [Spirochaetota bacterium]